MYDSLDIFSLDPEGDPLCLLLMIDYYALMADEYDYLLTLFQEWDVSRHCIMPA